MKLRWSLISAIVVLSTALALVLVSLVTGDGGGDDQEPVASETGNGSDGGDEAEDGSDNAPGATTPEDGGLAEAAERIRRPRDGEVARYVGMSDNATFAITIIVWEDRAIAYVGDGSGREAWLTGITRDNGEIVLGSEAGGVLNAVVNDERVTGSLVQPRWGTSFTVPLAEAPAGAYRAGGTVNGHEVVYSLVVLPDGRQTGIAWSAGAGGPAPKPAPAIDLATATLTDRGVTLTVTPIDRGQF